jgi:hypothetical protein
VIGAPSAGPVKVTTFVALVHVISRNSGSVLAAHAAANSVAVVVVFVVVGVIITDFRPPTATVIVPPVLAVFTVSVPRCARRRWRPTHKTVAMSAPRASSAPIVAGTARVPPPLARMNGAASNNADEIIWKEVLCRGRQCDARGYWFEIGARDIRDGLRNAKLMLSRGVPVPGVWEHQDIEASHIPLDDAQKLAEWKRRYAKYTFGHVAGARVNDRGNLDLGFRVPDPADRKQLAKSKFVSPKLYPSYSDSRGGRYAGTTVAHVAATPTPVQFWQRPFAVELSRTNTLYLSFTPGASDMADENETEEGGGKGEMGALIEALRGAGMNIPDEVKDIAGLIIAVKASGAVEPDGDEFDMDEGAGAGAGDDGMGETQAAGGAPLMMSMTHADPNVRSQVLAWSGPEKKLLKQRVKALFNTGRIDATKGRQLVRQIDSVSLSFTADAEAVSPVHKQIADLEKKPERSAWSRKPGKSGALDLSATREVGRPNLNPTAAGEPDPAVIKQQELLAQRMSASKK